MGVGRRIGLALVAGVLLLVGCAGKSAPVVVAQTSLGLAQAVGAVQQGAITLHTQGVIDTPTALRMQERLLVINGKIGEIVPVLKTLDRLQQAGVKPTAGEVDQVLTQVFLIAQELSVLAADVPGGSDQAKAFLELLRVSQQTVTTTLIEIARLRVALEG